MAEVAAETIRARRLCPPNKPLGVVPAVAGEIVNNKAAKLVELTVRGTVTTSGDTFTLPGIKKIVHFEFFYEGATPGTIISALPTDDTGSALAKLVITVSNGTIVHGKIWGTV